MHTFWKATRPAAVSPSAVIVWIGGRPGSVATYCDTEAMSPSRYSDRAMGRMRWPSRSRWSYPRTAPAKLWSWRSTYHCGRPAIAGAARVTLP